MPDAVRMPAEAAGQMERRYLSVELRAAKRSDKQPVIEGLAAVYNQETVIANWFREILAPGAFTRVLSENPDVVGAFNHDWNFVLGRTTAGTLQLQDSDEGLRYSIDINPEDPEAMSVYAKVQRGDVRQSSFAFTVRRQERVEPAQGSNELPLRVIREIGELFDVSPVTFPAYPQTSADARSAFEALRQEEREPAEQAAPGGAEAAAGEMVRRQKALRRRLDLIERS